MNEQHERTCRFLKQTALPDVDDAEAVDALARCCDVRALAAGESWVPVVDQAAHVCLVIDGMVVVRSDSGEPAVVGSGDGFALRAQRSEHDTTRISGIDESELLQFSERDYRASAGDDWPAFDQLLTSLAHALAPAESPAGGAEAAQATADASVPAARPDGFLQQSLGDLMTAQPLTVEVDDSIRAAATLMAERRISCLPVLDQGRLAGLVTEADMTARVVATGCAVDEPVVTIMTPSPMAVTPESSVFDLISLLTQHRVAHAPVVADDRLVGIVTQTDLIKRQTSSSLFLVHDIARLDSAAEIAVLVREIPNLLRNLVDGGGRAQEIGRMISAVTDAATRRLITLAEQHLGPPPGPYVWLACGSQGRQEQTGATDQDNCIVIDDAVDLQAHGEWFAAFAEFVCRGLDAVGYVFCPGDMMAMNPRWCQPLHVWRQNFRGWIANPGPEAQMLASVMFDLRPIHGESALFDTLQAEALEAAGSNSIFIAHLTSNALTHRVPLGLFGRLAPERRGDHRHQIDLKHRGTVPVIDLARVHALSAGVRNVNTSERLRRDTGASIISESGLRNLFDAYEHISVLRLRHQADQARAGLTLDNFIDPGERSELERDYLRRSFEVIKDIQSALGRRYAATGRS